MRRLTIQQYLLIYTVILLGGVMMATVWKLLGLEIRSIHDHYDNKAWTLADTLAASIADVEDSGSVDYLQKSTDTLRQDREITSVEIFNSQQKLVAQSGSLRYIRGELVADPLVLQAIQLGTHQLQRTEDHILAVSLLSNNPSINTQKGGVIITLSRQQEKLQIAGTIFRAFLFGFLMLASGLAAAWFMSRKFSNDIDKLASAALRIREGDYSARASDLQLAEIQLLGDVIHSTNQKLIAACEGSEMRKKRLQLILDNLPDVICECDASGIILFCNHNLHQLRSILEIVDPEIRPQMQQAIRKINAGDNPAPLEYEKEKRWYSIQVLPAKHSLTNHHILVIITNITDYKSAQQFKERNQQLLQALEESQIADKTKEQFLANMSHEIRTPMNSIIGFCELLSETPLNSEQREWVSIIQYNGQALIALINQILDLSKLRNSSFSIEKTTFDLQARFNLVLASFESEIRKGEVQLRHMIDPKLPEFIVSDPNAFHQILVNLLRNALKFTEKGSVTVTLEKIEADESNKPQLLLCVLDTGSGIPKDKQSQIFRPFAQVDPSFAQRMDGAGLGLSITKSIVELLDGSISFESEPGIGTVFRVKIPVEIPASAPKKQPSSDLLFESDTKLGKSAFGDLKLILAEDNPFNQKLIKLMLAKESIIPDIVADGEALIKALQKKPYDMVIMDVNMPKMNGLEATRLIRSGFAGIENQHIYVAAFTAAARREDAERCYKAGMDGFLSKPFKPEDLQKLLIRTAVKKQRERYRQNTASTPSSTMS